MLYIFHNISSYSQYQERNISMIAKEVRKTMIDKDLTVRKLAEITGYTYNHLCGVLSGRFDSLRAKKVIALALSKNFHELWGGQDIINTGGRANGQS